jgi:hypothetical protein
MAEPERSTASSLSLHIVPDQAEADGEMESKGSEARTTFERCVLGDFAVVLAGSVHLLRLVFSLTITKP